MKTQKEKYERAPEGVWSEPYRSGRRVYDGPVLIGTFATTEEANGFARRYLENKS